MASSAACPVTLRYQWAHSGSTTTLPISCGYSAGAPELERCGAKPEDRRERSRKPVQSDPEIRTGPRTGNFEIAIGGEIPRGLDGKDRWERRRQPGRRQERIEVRTCRGQTNASPVKNHDLIYSYFYRNFI
jgi:hypothetical protein